MRSTFLVGAAAWLLGAVTATTGSMIAVNELAHGLLGQQTRQLGPATVSADLDPGSSPSPATSASGRSSAGPTAAARTRKHTAVSTEPAGTLLESADGSVMAACQPAGAYLLYWSPDQGYAADDVYRGPAAITSVTFRSPAASLVMRVSCQGGTPVARMYRPSSDDDGSGSDDGSSGDS